MKEEAKEHISAACHKQKKKLNSKQIEFLKAPRKSSRRKTFISSEREATFCQKDSSHLSAMSPASAGSLRVFDWLSSSLASTCKFLLIVWILFISVTHVCCELNKNCEYHRRSLDSICDYYRYRKREKKINLWSVTVLLPFVLLLSTCATRHVTSSNRSHKSIV